MPLRAAAGPRRLAGDTLARAFYLQGNHRTGPRGLPGFTALLAPAASDEAWLREECQRVLRPGGTVLVTLYNARYYKGLASRLRRRLRRTAAPVWEGLYYQLSVAEHLRSWQAAGFQPIRMRGYYWAPLDRQSDSTLVAAGAAFERVLGLSSLVSVSPVVLAELRRVDQTPGT